jgi:hypothetical protein
MFSLRARQQTGCEPQYKAKRPKQQVKVMLGAAGSSPSYSFVKFLYIRSPAQRHLFDFFCLTPRRVPLATPDSGLLPGTGELTAGSAQ